MTAVTDIPWTCLNQEREVGRCDRPVIDPGRMSPRKSNAIFPSGNEWTYNPSARNGTISEKSLNPEFLSLPRLTMEQSRIILLPQADVNGENFFDNFQNSLHSDTRYMYVCSLFGLRTAALTSCFKGFCLCCQVLWQDFFHYFRGTYRYFIISFGKDWAKVFNADVLYCVLVAPSVKASLGYRNLLALDVCIIPWGRVLYIY